MKTLLMVLLLLAIILVLVPVPMGMGGMDFCPDCLLGHSGSALGLCLAVMAATFMLIALALLGRPADSSSVFRRRLDSFGLLRPPRLVPGL